MSKNNMKLYSEEKYRVRYVKSKKGWAVKGVLYSTILFMGGLVCLALPQTVAATEGTWTANTVEQIKARIKSDDKSITMEKGDTVWNIGLAINIKNPMELLFDNGFKESEQYTIPVGTVIQFDGNRVTVISPDGQIIGDKIVDDSQKFDASKTIAGQKSDKPSVSVKTDALGNVISGDSNPVTDVSQSGKENTETNPSQTTNVNNSSSSHNTVGKEDSSKLEEAKRKEDLKRKEEEARRKEEALKKEKEEAEKRLIEEINSKNKNSLQELQLKRIVTQEKVTEIQERVVKLTAQANLATHHVYEAREELNQAQSNVETSKQYLDQIQSDILASQLELDSLKVELDSLNALALENEDNEAQVKLQELENRFSDVEMTLTSYKNQVAQAEGNYNQAVLNADQAEQIFQGALSNLYQVENELAQANATLKVSQDELDNLPEENSVLGSNSEEAKRIQRELEELDKKIQAIERELSNLDEELVLLENQIKEIETKVMDESSKFEDIESTINNVDQVIDDSVLSSIDEDTQSIKDDLPDIKVNEELKSLKEAKANAISELSGLNLKGNTSSYESQIEAAKSIEEVSSILETAKAESAKNDKEDEEQAGAEEAARKLSEAKANATSELSGLNLKGNTSSYESQIEAAKSIEEVSSILETAKAESAKNDKEDEEQAGAEEAARKLAEAKSNAISELSGLNLKGNTSSYESQIEAAESIEEVSSILEAAKIESAKNDKDDERPIKKTTVTFLVKDKYGNEIKTIVMDCEGDTYDFTMEDLGLEEYILLRGVLKGKTAVQNGGNINNMLTVELIKGPSINDSEEERKVFFEKFNQNINDFRKEEGLNAIENEAVLNEAASIRAKELVEKFAHERPDGSPWQSVINDVDGGKSYVIFGENIQGIGYGDMSGEEAADKAFERWLNSPGHRSVMLSESATCYGIGYYYDEETKQTYAVLIMGKK